MYLRHFAFLQHVLQEGSFPAAAKQARVSQPAVSQAMRDLERSLGVTLFTRQGRQKTPTPEAYRLVKAYRELAAEIDVLRTASAPESSSAKRDLSHLRLGISSGAACLYGAAIAAAWRRIAGAQARLIMSKSDSPDLIDALQRQHLDLVITPRPRGGKYPALSETPLFSSTPGIYARVGHPLAASRSLAELAKVEWAVVGRTGTPGNMIAEAHRVRKLPEPIVRLECADYVSLLHAVADSDMMSVVPHSVLVAEMGRNKVRALHVREGLPRYEVCIYRRMERGAKAGMVARVCEALTATPPTLGAPAAPAARGGKIPIGVSCQG